MGASPWKAWPMSLTDMAIRRAKTRDKPYKLYDELGLFLVISPSGSRLWRMKFRHGGSEKKLSFGAYPQLSLRDARKMRDDARELLADGKDPSLEKQREKLGASALAENTFTSIANEYCRNRRRDGDRAWAPATAARCEYLLGLLGNSIGKMPIHEIEPIDALAAIRKIEKRGKLESARRTLQLAGAVFRYAVATARLRSDPTRDLRGGADHPNGHTLWGGHRCRRGWRPTKGHRWLRRPGNDEMGTTTCATRLCPPGRTASCAMGRNRSRRSSMDHPGREDEDAQAAPCAALASVDRDFAGNPVHHWVVGLRFSIDAVPNAADVGKHPQCRAAPLGLCQQRNDRARLRAMASTLLNESGKWSPDAIERSLAHGDSDRVRAAYHRGAHWKERVAMAQWWSDLLDSLRNGATILPFLGAVAG